MPVSFGFWTLRGPTETAILPTENLTDARVRGLKPEHGEITDIKSGVLVRATQAGVVSFSFRYRSGDARRRIVIGRYPTISLVDARAAAGRICEAVRNGGDPQAERRQHHTLTFDSLCDLYIERYAKQQKASWRGDAGFLRQVRAVWGRRDAASITRQDAARLVFDIAARTPVTANRTRSVLLKMYTWAVDAALLDVNPMLGTKKPHREGRGKTRTLSDPEIRTLWRALNSTSLGSGTVAALKTIILLGQRPGEVSGMAVDELHDLDNPGTALWTIPAHRMKARKAHLVPLPPLAREIITTEIERRARPEFVFASKYSRRLKLSRNALSESLAGLINKLDDAAGASLKADPPTPHDLRRSVATGLAKLGIVREDRLAVLAHSHNDVHDIHYDHYDRLPQKRAALEMWERHLRKVIADHPQTDGRVLPLWR